MQTIILTLLVNNRDFFIAKYYLKKIIVYILFNNYVSFIQNNITKKNI